MAAIEEDRGVEWEALASPGSASELALVESLLQAHEIPHFVHNEHFASMWPGPLIPQWNRRTVMVRSQDLTVAKELLAEPTPPTAAEDDDQAAPGESDRARPLLETLLFGWFVPGRRRNRRG